MDSNEQEDSNEDTKNCTKDKASQKKEKDSRKRPKEQNKKESTKLLSTERVKTKQGAATTAPPFLTPQAPLSSSQLPPFPTTSTIGATTIAPFVLPVPGSGPLVLPPTVMPPPPPFAILAACASMAAGPPNRVVVHSIHAAPPTHATSTSATTTTNSHDTNTLTATSTAAATTTTTSASTTNTHSLLPPPPTTIQDEHPERVPAFFKGKKIRGGKWLSEEEEYAKFLCLLFQKGYLCDCQEGTTLRMYLSAKLHCSPMRISKKFTGKSTGKMAYSDKRPTHDTANNNNNNNHNKSIFQKHQLKLKQLQDAFYKTLPEAPSTFQSPPPPPPIVMPTTALPPLHPAAWQLQMARLMLLQQQQQLQKTGGVPICAPAPTTAAPRAVTLGPLPPTGTPAVKAPTTPSAPGATQPQPPVVVPLTVPSSAPVSQPSTVKIQNPKPKVPQKEPRIPITTTTTSKPVSKDQNTSNSVSTLPPEHTSSSQVHDRQLKELHASFLRAVQSSREDSTDSDTSEESTSRFGNATTDQNPLDFVTNSASSLPVTSSILASSASGTLLHASQSLTSRSFDDFHKHLGMYLPPSESLVGGHQTGPALDSTNPEEADASSSLFDHSYFNPDSYAMFAIESANAASHHSAYMTNPVDWDDSVSGAFDVSGTVKLVAEHGLHNSSINDTDAPEASASPEDTAPQTDKQSRQALYAAKRAAVSSRSFGSLSSSGAASSTTSETLHPVSEMSASATEAETTSGQDSTESNNSSEETKTEESNESDSASSSEDDVKRKRRVAFEDDIVPSSKMPRKARATIRSTANNQTG